MTVKTEDARLKITNYIRAASCLILTLLLITNDWALDCQIMSLNIAVIVDKIIGLRLTITMIIHWILSSNIRAIRRCNLVSNHIIIWLRGIVIFHEMWLVRNWITRTRCRTHWLSGNGRHRRIVKIISQNCVLFILSWWGNNSSCVSLQVD